MNLSKKSQKNDRNSHRSLCVQGKCSEKNPCSSLLCRQEKQLLFWQEKKEKKSRNLGIEDWRDTTTKRSRKARESESSKEVKGLRKALRMHSKGKNLKGKFGIKQLKNEPRTEKKNLHFFSDFLHAWAIFFLHNLCK